MKDEQERLTDCTDSDRSEPSRENGQSQPLRSEFGIRAGSLPSGEQSLLEVRKGRDTSVDSEKEGKATESEDANCE
jgi:hypothetical protein